MRETFSSGVGCVSPHTLKLIFRFNNFVVVFLFQKSSTAKEATTTKPDSDHRNLCFTSVSIKAPIAYFYLCGYIRIYF